MDMELIDQSGEAEKLLSDEDSVMQPDIFTQVDTNWWVHLNLSTIHACTYFAMCDAISTM